MMRNRRMLVRIRRRLYVIDELKVKGTGVIEVVAFHANKHGMVTNFKKQLTATENRTFKAALRDLVRNVGGAA